MLIEKVYAKIHGKYYALSAGFTSYTMIDLTGCPTVYIKFPEDTSDYEAIKETVEEIFEKPLKLMNKGTLSPQKHLGGHHYRGQRPGAGSGLVSSYTYSIIQVKEGLGEKLVNIRNPWASLNGRKDGATKVKNG